MDTARCKDLALGGLGGFHFRPVLTAEEHLVDAKFCLNYLLT